MKKLFLTIAAALFTCGSALTAQAADSPLWMRYSKISPDGKQIAFAYKGDIYVVPANGGEAKQLTTADSYESQPVWSNDSKTIAFVSDRLGGMDIYTVPAAGGQAKRITTHSANETPLAFSPDNKFIYFSASLQDPASSILWAKWMQELYMISADGGRPMQITATPVHSLSFDKDGKSFLYEDCTGVENIWRKHHVSSVARNIFYYDSATDTHKQITTNVGEDRDPIFCGDGKMVFLSERNGGSFNVYEAPVNDAENVKALTNFKKHPIRFLSRANDGTLCFGFQGEIYTMAQGGKAQKVNISIVNDTQEKIENIKLPNANEFDISDDGKEIVIVSRGEVFATTDKFSTTKQITKTPEAELGVTISPDGKTIVYSSLRTGIWNLYKATRANKEDLHFANATLIDEEPLFKDNTIERTMPKFSPDGKEIAFIEDRVYLKVLNLETKKVRTITDGTQHHGYDETGFDFQWSPDCNWFTLTLTTNRRNPYDDIGIVSAKTGGKIYNVTNSGYIDRSPKWVMNGNAILFISNRMGMRSHASWGSQNDVFIAFMNKETMDKFTMSEEDYALYKEAEKLKKEEEKKESATKTDDKSKKVAESKNENKKDIVIELEGLADRVMRLTPMSGNIADAELSEDGESLYFLCSFEHRFDMWEYKTRTRDISMKKKLNNTMAYLRWDKDYKNLYILGMRPSLFNVSSGTSKPISFNASMDLDRAGERKYMFHNAVNQERHKFYNTNYHGIDLDQLEKDYTPFLDHINNNYDFAEMLSEFLGELNVSHTGSAYQAPGAEKPTPELGLLFDMKYTGDGLKVDDILVNGPFGITTSKVTIGTILEKIDGVSIKAGADYYPLLNGKQGKAVLFSFYNPATGERWNETAKPISRGQQNNMIYKRWIDSRAAEVERLSGGRLGYVHIQSMDDKSYRNVYADVLGKYNLKEGIVIDTRFNSGGRLHEDIEILFSGTKYLEQVMRGKISCDMPSRRYNKHSIMLVCEANYSNAHGTPWVYSHMGIGKTVGMPVPGTMTTVNWEYCQDPTLYFGIPVVGYRTREGSYLENSQLEPDFLVRNKAHEAINGRDEQLEVAVKELLKQIDADKDRW